MWQTILDGLYVFNENKLILFGVISILLLGISANIVTFYTLRKREVARTRNFSLLLIISLFILSIILRLAYLKDIFVPPYFDSVAHLRIINKLIEGFNTSAIFNTLPNLTESYYHFGFHFFVALLTFGLHADPINVMLISGQVILAAIPIPLFFIIKHKTENNTAALLTLLLAGFGWYMPAFAINWGKYPALTGLLSLEIMLSLSYAISQKKTSKNNFKLIIFLLFGLLVSTLIHSRILIVFSISLISWFLAKKAACLEKPEQHSILRSSFFGILILGILIQTDPLLKLTLEPYLDKGILITSIILILSPFAFKKFHQSVYFIIFFIFSILACLFIPVDSILPTLNNQTLLDRPFVEMLLYFPLSILGGLGLAGLLEIINKATFLSEKKLFYTKTLVSILVIGFVGVFSLKNYAFYPADCCNFISYDDTIIFDWLRKNISNDARILVAANHLSVVPSSTSTDLVGSDAGIWIPVLIDKRIVIMPYEIDFLSEGIMMELCQKKVTYIYVDNTNQSFNSNILDKKERWYKKILALPNTQLYQLKTCIITN